MHSEEVYESKRITAQIKYMQAPDFADDSVKSPCAALFRIFAPACSLSKPSNKNNISLS